MRETPLDFEISSSKRTRLPVALLVIFIVILLSVVYSKLSGSDGSLTFTGLLEWFSNYHPAFDNLQILDLSIQGDWGWFDGFRTFINMFTSLFSLALYVCGGAINAISYITGLVQFIFVG